MYTYARIALLFGTYSTYSVESTGWKFLATLIHCIGAPSGSLYVAYIGTTDCRSHDLALENYDLLLN